IFAASVGFIGSAALLINRNFIMELASKEFFMADVGIYSLSLLLLFSQKVSPPIVVIIAVLAGMVIA
ncbi:MAG: hypothetical protein P8O20_03585, partial [Bacteroidia bacterium]|nr:hypothetical protein [Bacteroidia bacterium]